MQGVIKAFDPVSAQGVIMCDTDLADYDIADGALDGSVFRMLRQGQRVVFDLDDAGRATAPARATGSACRGRSQTWAI